MIYSLGVSVKTVQFERQAYLSIPLASIQRQDKSGVKIHLSTNFSSSQEQWIVRQLPKNILVVIVGNTKHHFWDGVSVFLGQDVTSAKYPTFLCCPLKSKLVDFWVGV